MGSSHFIVLTESEVPGWRAKFLTEDHILNLLQESGSLHLRLPLGLGKSMLADRILKSRRFHDEFEQIIYVAPSWDIIHERELLKCAGSLGVAYTLLRARPKERCGALDKDWRAFERNGCGSYGKEALCSHCPERKGPQPCTWPSSLKDKIGDAKVIFLTEQHFILDPGFLTRIKFATNAEKILVILEEAKLSHASFETVIRIEDLKRFRESLAGAVKAKAETLELWDRNLTSLIQVDESELASPDWDFPMKLNWDAPEIQEFGIRRFGRSYRYLGHSLAQFRYSRPDERWKDDFGNIHYILRPWLGASVLALSANLEREYIASRLGTHEIHSPFENLRVRHTETRIFNLRSRMGAEKYFRKNHPQVLDFFVLLIARNIAQKKRTLLVVKKKFKKLCIAYLSKRLSELGLQAQFITEDFQGHNLNNPAVVPIIHYGIAGINVFEDYDCCYCLSSYYISDDQLNQVLQSNEPERFRIKVKIGQDSLGNRRVEIEHAHEFTNLGSMGNTYLRLLEIDPVLQAVGRVRFFTKPREVIFFQRHDLQSEVGDLTEFRSLLQAYDAFGLPRVTHLVRSKKVAALQTLMKRGLSLRQAANRLGIDKSTASRWMRWYGARKASQDSFFDQLIREDEKDETEDNPREPDGPTQGVES